MPSEKSLSRANKVTLAVAIIGGAVALIAAFLEFVLPLLIPRVLSTPVLPVHDQYIGRVLDANSLLPVENAKVTLTLEGVPPIVYTDSEGLYRFAISPLTEARAGQVRVDAAGYEPCIRNIELVPGVFIVDDIRLASSLSGTSTGAVIPEPGSWGISFFSNTNLDGSPVFQMTSPAEVNDKGGYTFVMNSLDLRSNSEIPTGNFSARLVGRFDFQAGEYEFICRHHDGCRIFVDGISWVDAWWDGQGEHALARTLEAGEHLVVVEFYDKSGLGLLDLYWGIRSGAAGAAPADEGIYLACLCLPERPGSLSSTITEFTVRKH